MHPHHDTTYATLGAFALWAILLVPAIVGLTVLVLA